MRATHLLVLTLLMIACAGSVWPQQRTFLCGSLANAYGPFDYTDSTHVRENLPVVEQHHFTPEVEALISGVTGPIWGDLDYTLRAFPNHHRALYAVARYASQAGATVDTGYYTPECYFRRAVAFKPGDGVVRMLYGIFLHRHDKRSEALRQYRRAVKLMPRSAEAHYNLGLLYADMGKLVNARRHADKAYALDYPLPGLKNKLREVGPMD